MLLFSDFLKVPEKLANKDGLFTEFSPQYLNKMRTKSIGLPFFSYLLLVLFLSVLVKLVNIESKKREINIFKGINKRTFSFKICLYEA